VDNSHNDFAVDAISVVLRSRIFGRSWQSFRACPTGPRVAAKLTFLKIGRPTFSQPFDKLETSKWRSMRSGKKLATASRSSVKPLRILSGFVRTVRLKVSRLRLKLASAAPVGLLILA
jgi:hypothetical protein